MRLVCVCVAEDEGVGVERAVRHGLVPEPGGLAEEGFTELGVPEGGSLVDVVGFVLVEVFEDVVAVVVVGRHELGADVHVGHGDLQVLQLDDLFLLAAEEARVGDEDQLLVRVVLQSAREAVDQRNRATLGERRLP